MTRIRPAPPGSRAATHGARMSAPRRRRAGSPYAQHHAAFSTAASATLPPGLPLEPPMR